MPVRQLRKLTQRACRSGLLAAAGLAFFVAAAGIPLPLGRSKDRSIPFPCMDRPCGCHDAAGCKAHCCCFSSEEKLAWATEHEVDPTPFVEDEALDRVQGFAGFRVQGTMLRTVPGFRIQEEGQPGCCRKKVASCCAYDAAEAIADSCDASTHQQEGPNSKPDNGLVTVAAYRECTGLQPLWTLLHAALLPPERVSCEFDWHVTGHVALENRAATIVSLSPATPPPRS